MKTIKIHSMKTASYYFSRRALQKMNTSMNPKLFIFSNAFLVWMNKEMVVLSITHFSSKARPSFWRRSFLLQNMCFSSISDVNMVFSSYALRIIATRVITSLKSENIVSFYVFMSCTLSAIKIISLQFSP